ncbi:MAG: hypothetical protein ACUVWV_15555 [Thermodesulfobacteriota bacterium]
MYELIWFFFVMIMGILLSIGLFGLILSPSLRGRTTREITFLLSVLILTGVIYLTYKWYYLRNEIMSIAHQAEQAIKHNATMEKQN